MSMKQFFFAILLSIALMAGSGGTGLAEPIQSHTIAKQAILVDAETGMVLFAKNADEKMPTSSMSKAMTIYEVFVALKDGRLSLDGKLKVSEKAWRKGGSKMFVEVGKHVAVEDLVRGVLIQSGNDATIVLAEGLAGTEESFAAMLNERAAMLGMKDSHFMNASGWPDPDHYSTARDLATLSAAIIRDFPEYYHYFSEREFTYNNIKQRNRNPLLYRDMGADGLKTGHTEVGGYGLMASGIRNGRRVILVMNGLEDEKARAQEGARLLEWGMKGFENVTLFEAGGVVGQAPIIMGKEQQVPLVIAEALDVTVPVTAKDDVKIDVVYAAPFEAPVAKGMPMATLRVDIPKVGVVERPLLAGADVKRLGFIAGSFAQMKLMIESWGRK